MAIARLNDGGRTRWVVLFELPDWPRLHDAATAFEAEGTPAARGRLEAALLEYVGRADLLTVLIECVDAQPSLD